jgi:hypothetical protein
MERVCLSSSLDPLNAYVAAELNQGIESYYVEVELNHA